MIEQRVLEDPVTTWRYKAWQQAEIDLKLKQQLTWMGEHDIQECFDSHLSLEREGMRGIIGAGTNRMNRYTVRRVAQGMAAFLLKQGRHKKKQGIVVGYDNRNMSHTFAEEAALVFAKNDIKVFLYEESCPTPELCFAIRELNTAAGIMITANHLPKQYNGIEMFNEDGGLLGDKQIESICTELSEIEHGFKVKVTSRESALIQGLMHAVGAEMRERYTEDTMNALSRPFWMNADANRLKVVYTPLHGTCSKLTKEVLSKAGFNQVTVIPEQEYPDERFPSVTAPDPGQSESYEMAIQTAKQERAHLIVSTDSSGEHAGVAIRTPKGNYLKLSSNQCSALLLNFLLADALEKNQLPDNGAILKSITASDLCRKIAASYGVHTINALPGFQEISEKKRHFQRTGEYTFLFGFSGSSQYAAGNSNVHADGIKTCLLLCEMASYYQARGKTLYEGLRLLYRQYGFYKEDMITLTLSDETEIEQMKKWMNQFHSLDKTFWGGRKLMAISDYTQGVRTEQITGKQHEIERSRSSMMKLHLEDDVWVVLHLLESELRFEMYFSVNAEQAEACQVAMSALKHDLTSCLFQSSQTALPIAPKK